LLLFFGKEGEGGDVEVFFLGFFIIMVERWFFFPFYTFFLPMSFEKLSSEENTVKSLWGKFEQNSRSRRLFAFLKKFKRGFFFWIILIPFAKDHTPGKKEWCSRCRYLGCLRRRGESRGWHGWLGDGDVLIRAFESSEGGRYIKEWKWG